MTELRLALLGPPVVLRDGLPVTFDTRKAVALLALLAVTGREHSREQLADLLWPEADSVKGRASLRRTLSVTAAAMGAGLTISRAAVTLELAAVQVDVREFEALIARADAESLERAVQLYRDDFLSGFVLRGCPDFEEGQALVSEGLREALARGLQRLVAACIAEGDLDRATGHARRWLQLDPLHEPAHQAIIRLHGWAGQRSAAMRQYRSVVRVLDRGRAGRPAHVLPGHRAAGPRGGHRRPGRQRQHPAHHRTAGRGGRGWSHRAGGPLPRWRDRAAVRAGRRPAAHCAGDPARPAGHPPGADGRDGRAAGPGAGRVPAGRDRPGAGQPAGGHQAVRRRRGHPAGGDRRPGSRPGW